MLDGNFPAYSVELAIAGVSVHWLTAAIFRTFLKFQLPGAHIREVKFMKHFKSFLFTCCWFIKTFHNDEGKAGF